MRILICDDDEIISEQIRRYLQEYFRLHKFSLPEIIIFQSGEALLDDKGPKDIVFLDVEMPGLSGISAGSRLKKRNPDVLIFIITSYMEYLDEAMRFQIFRYLSKPLDKRRLFRNMDDAVNAYYRTSPKIAVETKTKTSIVSASNIVCVEARERKVIVHTTQTDHYSIRTMQYWSDTLAPRLFFRSHKSFIVNLEHVTDYSRDTVFLDARQLRAYLTRRKYSEFKKAYFMYLESTN